MGGRTGAKRATVAKQSVVSSFTAFDRGIARELSGRIAEAQRLAFAQSFTFGVMQACRNAAALPHSFLAPFGGDLMALSEDAQRTADEFGKALAKTPPQEAAYLAGVIYTAVLPEAYRAAHGIFYTPPTLVNRLLQMADDAAIDWRTARVLDPSCGGGAFMIPMALRMAEELKSAEPVFVLQQIATRLCGFELDPFGAWLAQAGLELALQDVIRAAGRPAALMVQLRDSLDIKTEDCALFDLVIGNPPYGRVTPSLNRRAFYARSVYGHANLYGLFTDAALHWTKPGGVIAYVTPTSMLSGLYYKALRQLLAVEAPPLAINFVDQRDGVFADALQETMLATYRRAGTFKNGKVGFIAFDRVGYKAFRKGGCFALPAQPDAPWLLPREAAQVGLTRNLRAMPHRLADYGYGVSTGPLVWNRFKEQLHHDRQPGRLPVVWAESVTSDGRFLWRSEKRNHAPWFEARLPKDQWLIVTKPCVLLQRTTAKEQPRRLIAAEMTESFVLRHKGVIVENHLNMIRAIDDRPAASASVIAVLLNSATVDAAFRCLNGSVAVSAFELEQLPLPSPSVLKKLAKFLALGASSKRIETLLAKAYARDDAAAAA